MLRQIFVKTKKNMKKIISFSLFGSNPKYNVGIICNLEIAKVIYPDWICRVYIGDSVPLNTINQLKTYNNCELVFVPENNKNMSYMWRFLAIDDCDIALSRDADSRLSFREKSLVDEFLLSECLFHHIRDHPKHQEHKGSVMAGMWGMKKNNRVCMKEAINIFLNDHDYYSSDQNFLRLVIAPLFTDCTLLHDVTSNPSESKHFIGEIFPPGNFGAPLGHIFY
jgi:hypothetical protein